MGRLDGRIAIVTGAGQGIGRGIARRYAREGATVVVAEVNPETGAAVAEEITGELGGRAVFVETDVLDRDQVDAVVARTVADFGTVHVLVNNAYVAGAFGPFESKDDGDLELAFRGGPLHTWWAMRAVFPHMRDQRWGRIVNFVSLNGVNAHKYSADYNAAKEGIRALTRTAAVEWGVHNVLVNCIAPGAATPAYLAFAESSPENAKTLLGLNPLRRMGDPEHDIGGVALFLASEDADYVTGNTMFVGGGTHVNGVAWNPSVSG